MELLINKRGEVWQYRFETAKINGKRKWISKSGFQTKKEALQEGHKAIEEYNSRGKVKQRNSMSFYDLCDLYMKRQSPSLKDNSVKHYEREIRLRLKPLLGAYDISDITKDMVKCKLNTIEKESMRKESWCMFNRIFDFALENEYIADSPMPKMKFSKRSLKVKEDIITPEIFQKIISLFPENHRVIVPLYISFFCGTRVAETTAITWDRIDLENDTIIIDRQLQGYVRKEYKLDTCKTQNSERLIKIGKTLHDVLVTEKERQEENRKRLGEYYYSYEIDKDNLLIRKHTGESKKPLWFVCVNECGEISYEGTINYHLRTKVNPELNMHIHSHLFRHSHATLLVEAGANLKGIQMRMGHSDIRTTMNIYVHHTDNMANNTKDTFEEIVHQKI